MDTEVNDPPGEQGPVGRPPTFIERARRRQIVEATIAILAEVGYAKTTFAKIARRAEISPGLISYHFGSKDDLLLEVARHIEAAMEQGVEASVEDATDCSAVLRGLIEAQVRYFADHTDQVLALGAIFSGATSSSAPLLEWATTSRSKTIDDLTDLFTGAQEAGEFRAFAPRPMAVALLATLEAVPAELFGDPTADAGALGRELGDLFEAATRPRPARPRRSARTRS